MLEKQMLETIRGYLPAVIASGAPWPGDGEPSPARLP
jgi:hypothetical protein